jgi:hypothetical protein
MMTGPHVPLAPCPFLIVEQASQSPVQALLQHTASTQLLLRHSVPMAQASPFADLQLPLPSHDIAAPEHIIVALVSSCPAGLFEQVPTLPVTLQALHVPKHAVLQQTPSMQLPLEHWAAAVHAAPLMSVATHDVPEQKNPARQSLFAAHEVLHIVAPQMYGEQSVVPAPTHIPMPSHISASCCVEPVHEAGAHSVVKS